jgi:hypothetical protein
LQAQTLPVKAHPCISGSNSADGNGAGYNQRQYVAFGLALCTMETSRP